MKTSPFFITGMGVAALLLGGCTLAPDYQAPKLDLPDQPLGQSSQEAPQAAEHLQQWWTRFDSPTLNQWVDEVLAANRDLQKAAARIEQSRATLGLQSSGLLPTLSAQGAATRQQYALSQVSSENLRIQNRFNLSGMLSYEVDLFGKLRSARSAAKEGLIASEYGYQSLQNALIAETITTWLNLAAANEQLTLAEETVRTRQESLEVQTTRYKAGFITELEAQQAAAELADAEIQLPALRQAIQQLHTSLLVLAGREPSEIWADQATRWADLKLPTAAEPEFSLMPMSILEGRPDVAAAEAELRAAYHQIGVARANRWPTLSLSAALGSSVPVLEDLFIQEGETWSSGASLSGPIYDFGRSKNRIKSAEVAKEIAEINYRAVVVQAFSELKNSWDGINFAAESLEARQRQQHAITRTLELARSQYESGYTEHLDLLDAERRQFQADLAIVNARLQHLVSMVQFYKSIGVF